MNRFANRIIVFLCVAVLVIIPCTTTAFATPLNLSHRTYSISELTEQTIKTTYHGLPITGNLYGKYGVYTGTSYRIQFSAGTAVATVLSAILAVATGTGIGLAVLAALSASTVGSVIDTAISGRIMTKSYRWDYEVWANNLLGLRTYQADVYVRVVDTYTGNIEEVFDHEIGRGMSREDLCITGAYNVYIGAV